MNSKAAESSLTIFSGLRIAVSWLTILPLPHRRYPMNSLAGGRAIAAVPVVGIFLGAITALTAFTLSHTELPVLLSGILLTALLGLLTRGMHLDGLSDTFDALGSYGTPERVAAILKGGTAGPFGVASVVFSTLITSVGFSALSADHRWIEMGAVIFISRLTPLIICRRGSIAANKTGFGAIVANTQRFSIIYWLSISGVALAGYSYFLHHETTALKLLLAVIVVSVFSLIFSRHCAQRFGGLVGDTLGASIELSLNAALLCVLV